MYNHVVVHEGGGGGYIVSLTVWMGWGALHGTLPLVLVSEGGEGHWHYQDQQSGGIWNARWAAAVGWLELVDPWRTLTTYQADLLPCPLSPQPQPPREGHHSVFVCVCVVWVCVYDNSTTQSNTTDAHCQHHCPCVSLSASQ